MIGVAGFGWPGRLMAMVGVVAVSTVVCASARADKIVLKGGRTIDGVVVPDPTVKNMVFVQTATIFKPLKFAKSEVVEILAERSVLGDYLTRRRSTADTASAQFELAQWCDKQHLNTFAKFHYQQTTLHDPEFAAAHKKLGHVKYDDRWMTYDEYKVAQGLVKVKGKWVSPEEKEKREAVAALTAEQEAWKRRIRIMYQSYRFGTPAKQREAELQLMAVEDSSAVPGLVAILGQDREKPVRLLLSQILGAIKGPDAASALVKRVIVEADPDILDQMMTQLRRHDEAIVVTQLIKTLKAPNPFYVNRAAWVLGELQVQSAVPKLVAALITYQDKMVMDQTAGGQDQNAEGIGFGSIGPGMGVSGANSAARGQGGHANLGPSMTNMNSVPYVPMVGAVAAPGVVAFGATGVPLGDYVGGGGMNSVLPTGPQRSPEMRYERQIYHNVEVLKALEKLTDQHLGYDIPAWARWVNTKFRISKDPVRKVPQS